MGSAFGSALLPALARRRFLELHFSTSQGACRGAHSHHRKHENYVFNREEHWISLHLNRAILMLIILRASVMGSEGKCGKRRQSDEVGRSTMLCSFSVSSLGLWYAANDTHHVRVLSRLCDPSHWSVTVCENHNDCKTADDGAERCVALTGQWSDKFKGRAVC